MNDFVLFEQCFDSSINRGNSDVWLNGACSLKQLLGGHRPVRVFEQPTNEVLLLGCAFFEFL